MSRYFLAALALVLTPVIVTAASGSGARTRYDAPPNGQPLTPSSVTTSTMSAAFADAGTLYVHGPITLDSTTGAGVNGCRFNPNVDSNFLYFQGCNLRTANTWYFGAAITAATTISLATVADSATAPTVANGCTGEAMAWNNGTGNFEFDVGTSCTGVSTSVITLPAATTCWNCHCWNVTGRRNLMQSACSTTTATITNMGTSVATPADWTDGDNIQCSCRGG